MMSPARVASSSQQARPSQSGLEEVWVADLEEHELLAFWALNSEFEEPCWSPDGRYIAFVASDPGQNRWGLKVAEVDGSSAVKTIPLPGSSGSAACVRSAYQVSWNSTGDRLAVTMGGCRSSEGPQELEIWVIDPSPFLGK
jgi:Tol biopolymer transport system component